VVIAELMGLVTKPGRRRKSEPYYTMKLQKLANRGASTKAPTIG
jgi:hypothetical protein